MSDDPDDPGLIALGVAISEGATIDWREAERSAGSEEKQRLVQGLRDLAALVAAHRAAAADPADSLDPLPKQPAPRPWRHLVLFEPLGGGAFGTVFRGWDPQLEREVAVKLLKKDVSSTGSPLAEARHLARIRHANIVTAHGADQDDGQVGIWMEYIEGQTLAEMVRDAGPMSAREMTGIGIDLCRALSALHGAGLLHRDIKAQNVMREIGGRIVLMDFSGAQSLLPESGPEVFSGTPLYMAPELFDGASASIATDVYSLGILLFFLLTGSVPVDGATVSDVKRAHAVRARKELRDLRTDLAEPVVQVIERAIEPDPARRYRTAGELERALATASGLHSVPAQFPVTEPKQGDVDVVSRWWTWTLRAGWLAAALAVGSVGWLAAARMRPVPPSSPMTRFLIGPPFNFGAWPRLSPDGTQLAFGTVVEGRSRFWIRTLDSLDGRALMNTTATETPFWSPDGRVLVFFADQKLKRIQMNAEDPETIADAPHPRGGDWFGDWILFSTTTGIWRVAADGSKLAALTTLDQAQRDFQHGWPRFLPDGKRFIFMIRSANPERAGMYIGALDGRMPVRFMPAYSRVNYANGYLFYVKEGTLFAQPFDADSGVLSGTPTPLSGRVKAHAGGDAAFDVTPTGVLIFSQESGQPQTRLVLMDRRGRELQALTDVGPHRQPRFSPDGQRVVAETVSPDNNVDLWLYGVARPSSTRLTSNDAPDVRPVWTPDGTRVLFSSKRPTNYRVFRKMVDGTGEEEPIQVPPGDVYVEHLSPDQRYITASILRNGLWIIPLAPGQKPWQFRADARATAWQSEFSPDGRWLAYMSEESDSPEVYVEPFPATGARWQVSTLGGAEPHWQGANNLFYLAADDTIMMTTVGVPNWQYTKPMKLFRVSVPDLAGNTDFAVSPDGERFVVNAFVAEPIVPPIETIVNWQPLLGR